jgi:pimeloyl-ACP methyl ester carboxylesterase
MMTVNAGSGPPVVFIAQLGTGGDSWKPVIQLMRSGTTTVTYDRPGTGNCPTRPAETPPLPYSTYADELVAMLDEHDVGEPAVVVAHSIGCLIARVLTGRHSDRVAGMVFIDGSIPRRTLWPAGPLDQPPDGDHPHASHFDTLAGEIEVLEAVIPPMPAAVIMRTPGRWPENYTAGADALWIAHQRHLARQFQAPLIVASDTGHQIPREAPALVALTADAIVNAVRTGETWTPEPTALESAGGSLHPDIAASVSRSAAGRTR